MEVLLRFTHRARPYTTPDEYGNIRFEAPESAIPQQGDILSIKGITHPLGAFVVAARVVRINPATGIESVELLVGLEGEEKD